MSNKGMLDMTMLAMESRTSVVVSTIGPESKGMVSRVAHRDSVMPVGRCAMSLGMLAMESLTSVVVYTIGPESKGVVSTILMSSLSEIGVVVLGKRGSDTILCT